MTQHSKLPPSSAARRVACPGSRSLEERFPQLDSPASREGEAAHHIAAWMLQFFGQFPTVAPNGEPITEEMLDGATLYRDHVHNVLSELVGVHDFSKLQIERRIDIPSIHPECFGTPDCWLFYADTLHVWDYKFGHGFVDVFENWQMIEYTAGILDLLEVDGIYDRQVSVYFHIVQPRCYHRDGHIRTWQLKACDLRPYFNILRATEETAIQPFANCTPNPLCANCSGRHACESLQRAALSAIDASLLSVPLQLNATELGSELRYLKRSVDLLEARIAGLSEQALSMLKKGQRVPYFKLEEAPGRDAWKVPPEEVSTLGGMFGIKLDKPPQVITPKQAIAAGMPADLVKLYLAPTRAALKLVADDGKSARKIFGGDKE